MKRNRSAYIKNILLPCFGLSAITGGITGVLIFLFKWSTTNVIEISSLIYSAVRSDPVYLPFLIVGALAVGLLAAFILKYEPSCRGGGIPTSIAVLRGLITFQWLRNLLAIFTSAILTYFGGIPLGTEGPSVMMGTSLGRGTVRLLAKDNLAWDRYIMTGGACAGFSCATGAPLTGIIFAFEEAHRRFSPMIFMSAATAVFSGHAVSELLCGLTNTRLGLFALHGAIPTLPMKYVWAPLAVGIVSGILAILLTKFYRYFRKISEKSRIPLLIKVPIIFGATALIGFASSKLIGSGHSLIDLLIEGHGVWYFMLLYLGIRAIMLVIATNIGITGGLFIPSLAFGALIGALMATPMIALGWLPQKYYVLMITVGMAAFLAAFSRTPLMAIAFSFEALGGIVNLLPMIVGITFAYITIETAGTTSFSESVVEGKEETEIKGKQALVVDEHVTVAENSFAVSKEIRDILWPPTCTVLSVKRNPDYAAVNDGTLHPGDILHLHYRTYHAQETKQILEAIVGVQDLQSDATTSVVEHNHLTPQL